MSHEISEGLEEQAKPIIQALCANFIALVQANKGQVTNSEAILEALEDPEKFKPLAFRTPADRHARIRFYVMTNENLEDSLDVDLPHDLKQELMSSMTPADSRTLIEHLLGVTIALYQKRLDESDPAHLDAKYNDYYTNREILEAQINGGQSDLEHFRALDPQTDIRESIL